MLAYSTNQIHAHNRVVVKMDGMNKPCFNNYDQDDYVLTSVGKIIFNTIFPKDFQYLNEFDVGSFTKMDDRFIIKKGTNIKEYVENLPLSKPYKKGDFGPIIKEVFTRFKTIETSKMMDNLKDLGFKYSTKSGVTISINDIKVVPEKEAIIAEADKVVDKTNAMFEKGLLDEKGRYEAVIKKWEDVKKQVSNCVEAQFKADKFNPLCIISESGARGSIKNFSQLCGMRGPMANTTGQTIEIPIKSSFREGLTVSEFFISTHGARKGNTDTALKTADAGYLTRRLIDVSHDIIVNEEDCGCDAGTIVRDLINEKENTVISSLQNRLYGRTSMRDVVNPATGEIIVHANELITRTKAKEIVNAGIKEVEIRTLFACKSEQGVCRKCYGINLATGNEVEIGEAVGVMAAQSIGERGTQLTMRTFHTGGVAGADITQGLPRIQELVESRNPKGEALITEISGEILEINENGGRSEITIANKCDKKTYVTNFGSKVIVKVGDNVKNGQQLTDGSINPKQLLEVSDVKAVQQYILKEIKKVYKLQGDEISDKHIEVIVRQMLRKMTVLESGDSDLLPGTRIVINDFTRVNKEVLLRGGRPAVARPMVLGITKASLETDSFLSSASFQETNRMLTDAVIKGKYDYLKGLKENVIVGKLIPAGTGLAIHQDIADDIELDDDLTLLD
jgi:DNA-directed RNA polymerase subunit beta'